MNDKNLVIEMTKANKFYVAIKSFNQEKQIFCCIKKEDAYRQILRFLMGYLTGYSEKQPLSYDKLNTIITTLGLVFDIDLSFLRL